MFEFGREKASDERRRKNAGHNLIKILLYHPIISIYTEMTQIQTALSCWNEKFIINNNYC